MKLDCYLTLFLFLFFTLFLKFIFYWSIFGLQCCVSFRRTAKWFSYTYICVPFQILFHYGLSWNIECCSSLCNTAGPCWLSSLYIIVAFHLFWAAGSSWSFHGIKYLLKFQRCSPGPVFLSSPIRGSRTIQSLKAAISWITVCSSLLAGIGCLTPCGFLSSSIRLLWPSQDSVSSSWSPPALSDPEQLRELCWESLCRGFNPGALQQGGGFVLHLGSSPHISIQLPVFQSAELLCPHLTLDPLRQCPGFCCGPPIGSSVPLSFTDE